MNIARRILLAFQRSARSPATGRLLTPRREDSVRDYPGAGLTPRRLAAILKEADAGSLSTPMQLFEEMEEKDPHLYAVANSRRLGLTGLPWEIISAAELDDRADRVLAEEAAAHTREVLQRLEGFEESLQHLSLAIGRNLAVAEIVWEAVAGELRPVELVPVDFTRLVFDEWNRLRILTEEEPRAGIAPPPHKFIVHAPHSTTGHPQRGGLLRVTALVYLAKNLALKDWMIFAEIFGMPVRIARYEPSATEEEKRELLRMLETLGSHATGIFSRAVELQFIESRRGSGGSPYQGLIEFLNREMSKAWLGQTLTTDITGQSGSIAAARVHADVRRDILLDDARKESRTLRRDLLTPLTVLRFGSHAPVPLFRRKLKPAEDTARLAEVLDTAVNRLGLAVPAAWVREALGLPAPGADADTLRGATG